MADTIRINQHTIHAVQLAIRVAPRAIASSPNNNFFSAIIYYFVNCFTAGMEMKDVMTDIIENKFKD